MATRYRLAIILVASIIAGWLIGAIGLLTIVELTDGKVFDTEWLST